MDDRPPARIFHLGFSPLGSDASLYDHVVGASCQDGDGTSGFVSTSASERFAIRWGRLHVPPGRHFYVYRIRLTTRYFDVTRSLLRAHDETGDERYRNLANEFGEEAEWVTRDPIPANHVVDAIEYVSRGALVRPEVVRTHINFHALPDTSVEVNTTPYVWNYAADDLAAEPTQDEAVALAIRPVETNELSEDDLLEAGDIPVWTCSQTCLDQDNAVSAHRTKRSLDEAMRKSLREWRCKKRNRAPIHDEV